MYKLDWEPNGVSWKYYGNVSGEEVIEASIVVYGNYRFDDLRFKLVDFLDVESINMDENQIAEIAHQHLAAAISNPRIKTAIVVKEHMNEMAILFASFFKDSNWEVKIFQDKNEAYNWIGRI